jgi:sulfite exporter TauE/SafE
LKSWFIPALAVLLLLIIIVATQAPQPVQHGAAFAAIQLLDKACTVDPVMTSGSRFFVLLSAGLLTGFSHCVGMCGPLTGAFAARRRAAKKELSSALVLFQLGRLATYLILGGVVGGLGQLFMAVTQQWQILFSIILGFFVSLVGLGLWGLLPLQRWIASIKLAYLVSGWLKQLIVADHPAAPFSLGLANGLLPCGPVYALSLVAAVAGGPLGGAAIMFVFGLGTLPAMFGFGFSASLLGRHWRGNLYRVAATLVVLIGLQLTLRGLALGGQISHVTIGSVMLW